MSVQVERIVRLWQSNGVYTPQECATLLAAAASVTLKHATAKAKATKAAKGLRERADRENSKNGVAGGVAGTGNGVGVGIGGVMGVGAAAAGLGGVLGGVKKDGSAAALVASASGSGACLFFTPCVCVEVRSRRALVDKSCHGWPFFAFFFLSNPKANAKSEANPDPSSNPD